MKKLKKIAKKIVLLIFIFLALLKTYEGLSGIKVIPTFKDWSQNYVQLMERPATGVLHFLHSALFKGVKAASIETNSSVITIDEDLDLSQFPREVVVATGYTAGYESTGKHPDHPEFGITYSGVKVTRDLFSTVAADLDIFPLGTILYIPGYGYGVVADKGGAIKGKKVDLYYETVEDVYSEWGKKTVEVYVIKMGDGHLTEDDLKALNENESLQVLRQKFIDSEGQ